MWFKVSNSETNSHIKKKLICQSLSPNLGLKIKNLMYWLPPAQGVWQQVKRVRGLLLSVAGDRGVLRQMWPWMIWNAFRIFEKQHEFSQGGESQTKQLCFKRMEVFFLAQRWASPLHGASRSWTLDFGITEAKTGKPKPRTAAAPSKLQSWKTPSPD